MEGSGGRTPLLAPVIPVFESIFDLGWYVHIAVFSLGIGSKNQTVKIFSDFDSLHGNPLGGIGQSDVGGRLPVSVSHPVKEICTNAFSFSQIDSVIGMGR